MTAPQLFEDFGSPKPDRKDERRLDAEEVEDQKLEAFESGYQAGWDDAVKAQSETLNHVSSGLAASLQSASFEYHELRATLNSAVQNILEQVLGKILPEAAHASLGGHVRELITSAVRNTLDRPIALVVAPESEHSVMAALADDMPEPFTLELDPMMTEAQAVIRIGEKETEIDLDRVIDEISSALSAFFETQPKEDSRG